MGYSRTEFRELKAAFDAALLGTDGEPKSCRLYDDDLEEIEISDDLASMLRQFHIPEACNIAGVISSIQRLLGLPRSDVACSELSEVLIISLDMLRENIRDAVGDRGYLESDADRSIRRWAGFLKHPRNYVFAHRCFDDDDELEALKPIKIDTEFLAAWDQLRTREKDRKKAELARNFVVATLPAVPELTNFFASCATHLDLLIRTGRHQHS